MSAVSAVSKEKEIEARRKRAEEALASGKYRITKRGSGVWEVVNGDGEQYTVTVSTENGKREPKCTCPDFQFRAVGTCKHIEMVRLVISRTTSKSPEPAPTPVSKPAQSASKSEPAPAHASTASSPATSKPKPESPASKPAEPAPKPTASQTPSKPTVSQTSEAAVTATTSTTPSQPARPAASQNRAAPNTTPAPVATVPTSTQDPGEIVVEWGKYKGQRLSDVPQGFLGWLAFKMEVRSDKDRVLQEAARALLDRRKAERPKAAKAKPGADPVAQFIVQAGLEILREVFQAQGKGRSLDDPVLQKGVELRIQAIRVIAGKIREVIQSVSE